MNKFRSSLSLALWLLFSATGFSQGNKYFIRFKDKAGTPFSVQQPDKFLSKRSIDRRLRYGISIVHSDLPVTPSYIDQLQSISGTVVRFPLKWLNGIVVSFTAGTDEGAALGAINGFPFVESSSKVRRLRRTGDIPDSTSNNFRITNGSEATSYDYGGSLNQAQQLNVTCLHEKGFRGQGMLIAVMDAGFASVPNMNVFDSLRNDGRLLGTRDFVNGGTNAYTGGDHGTMVLSCMAAIKPGTAIGTAPLASYWLLRTEEGGAETISEEYNWIRAAEFADSLGADILTTSLGYTTFDDPGQDHTYQDLDGRTAPMSIAGTMAARKAMFVLNAAGNDGDKQWHYIGVPGDADSICTVGSVNGGGFRSAFSSVGPTADGRTKPDLMAQGEGCWVCSSTVCFPGNGTSFATPVLAGGVACYWQANRKLNNIELLNLMRNIANGSDTVNNRYGWGIPKLCDSLLYPVRPPDQKDTVILPPPGEIDFTVFAGATSMKVWLPPADYGHINVDVMDLLGKTIFTAAFPGNQYTMNLTLPWLPEGVYIVRVSTEFGDKCKKVRKLGL